jgi:hypothetical protein
MRLWLLTTNHYDYDQYSGFVVRATNEKKARELAAEACGRSGNGPEFLNPKRSKCEPLSARGEAEVILESFNAG